MLITRPEILFLLLISLPPLWWVGYPRYVYRRVRDSYALLIRTLIIVLIVLALAGLQTVQSVERQAVIFLVDASDSIGQTGLSEQISFIEQALMAKDIEDMWALVVFGANTSVDKPFSTGDQLMSLNAQVQGNQTDIANALQTAMSLFPSDVRPRIVLMSDGVQTTGDARTKAQLAQALGIEIDVVPIVRDALPDVRVVALDAPERVLEGQAFDISLTLHADIATSARLLLLRDGALISEQSLILEAGTTRYTLPQAAGTSGFSRFTATIMPMANDAFVQNNQLSAFTQSIGAPRLLVVASPSEDVSTLISALEEAGYTPERLTPARIPTDSGALADVGSLFIVNVPASDFTQGQMMAINRTVRELGMGLVMIGGEDAYGAGGYSQTPIEDALPVEMQIRDQERIPQLTIIYLLDRSGSMSIPDITGIPRLELAKRAIDLSIALLQPTDRVGIAGFDTGGLWIANLQDVDDSRTLQAIVGTIRSGGGTDILAGLNLVSSALVNDPSEVKHLILLTDGEANPRGLVDKVTELREAGVTLTVIGLDGGTPVLRQMAEAGEGNFHALNDLSTLPNILASETLLATRSYLIEEPFIPVIANLHPTLGELRNLPTLQGYVATTLKETAQLVLVGNEPYRDPILATWQYGLGRAVAFTSDASARWAQDWVIWQDFPQWWGQVVGWTLTDTGADVLDTSIQLEGEYARITVDARDAEGAFLNNLTLSANILAPDGSAQRVPLQQIAPALYSADFLPVEAGAYFIALSGTSTQGDTFTKVEGWVMSYSPEYAQTQRLDSVLLGDIASISNGRNISTMPESAFDITQTPRQTTAPLAPYLLAAAMVLWVVDVAVRRLLITREDWQRLRAWWSRRRSTRTIEALTPEDVSTVSALLKRKRGDD